MSGTQRELTFRFLAEPTDVNYGGIRFVSPIRISDLVTITAKLVYTGTSSMHFAVDVRARDPMRDDGEHLCTHCMIVFVAMDATQERSVPVPRWEPVDDDDRRLAEYALKVMALSKDIEHAVARLRPE
jgi:acyl-CoA hydrolase